MQYLFVDKVIPALEEMELLITEISGERLVDADDVAEELNAELDDLQATRNKITTDGMDLATADAINAAVESFFIHTPRRTFTLKPSIEGVRPALEVVDQQTEGVLSKLWKWLLDRLRAAREWLAKLFGKGGKADEAIQQAKDMAEDVTNNRKPGNVSKMVKDPVAADQEARIQPQGPKSGKYEDFVEKHKQYSEGLKADYDRMMKVIASNKVLSTICTSPESVDSFFTHMGSVQDKTGQVRNLVDKAANLVRSKAPVEQVVSQLASIRQELYQLFGGQDASVMESIRQQVFTDQTAAKFESIDYDKLVPIMTKVTGNVPAANAQQRINELDQLTKAVTGFEAIANTNVLQRLDPTERNAILSAMRAMANDIGKFTAAFTQDWGLVLQIYTGMNTFFQQERAFYYKMIAAIQRAASEVFEDADRQALYDNFKHLGFAMDLSPEDFKRRGVGMESIDLSAAFAELDLALEEIDVPHPGDVPSYGNIFAAGSSGLMAALEEEAKPEDKQGFFAKIKEWFLRFVNWVKSFFIKKVDAAEKKVEVVVEKKKEQTQQEESFAQSQGTTREQAVSKVRPEVKAIFDKRFNDSIWYVSSKLISRVNAFLDSRQGGLFFALAGEHYSKIVSLMADIANNNTRLWLAFKATTDAAGLVKLASGENITSMGKNFQQIQQLITDTKTSTATAADLGAVVIAANRGDDFMRSNRWYVFKDNVMDAMNTVQRIIGGDLNAQPAEVQQAAKNLQQAMNACMTMANMVSHTYSLMCFPTFIDHHAAVLEMFEEEQIKPSEAEVKLLTLDPRWNPPFKL